MGIPEIKPISMSESGQYFLDSIKVLDEAIISACVVRPYLLKVPPLTIDDILPLIFIYLWTGGKIEDVEGALLVRLRDRPYYKVSYSSKDCM